MHRTPRRIRSSGSKVGLVVRWLPLSSLPLSEGSWDATGSGGCGRSKERHNQEKVARGEGKKEAHWGA